MVSLTADIHRAQDRASDCTFFVASIVAGGKMYHNGPYTVCESSTKRLTEVYGRENPESPGDVAFGNAGGTAR